MTDEELPAALAATPPSVDPLVGSKIGEFVIQERVGAGGMGVVYRAEHPLIGKHAAIKVMRAELVSPEQEQRLLVEARAVNAIRHPGVLDIFNFGTLPDCRPYVVMELLQGQSLADRMREQDRMDVGTTAWVLDQVLAALGAAHRAGVVHRDLKPANVFLMEQPDAAPLIKLVDFGIAKVMQAQDALARADGSTLGTPDFMAPEQIRGGEVGPAVDLYALGVMAFQMLTGTRPFQGDNVQVMFAHVEQVPPRVSSRVEGIPPELDDLVLQLMEKEPARRPASAAAVRLKLRGLARPPAPSGGPEAEAAVRQEAEAPPGVASQAAPEVPASQAAPEVPASQATPEMPKREEPTALVAPAPAVAVPGHPRAVSLAVAAVSGVALLGVGYWWGAQAGKAELALAPPRPPEPVMVDARPAPPVAEPPPITATQPPVEEPPEELAAPSGEEAPAEAETATQAKSTKLPPLPTGTAAEKKLEQRLAGLFKLQLARAKDVDAEGALRAKLIQQYRAAADAKTDAERARIHAALDDIEKELTQRIALHDAPPAPVTVVAAPAAPQPPQVPALVIPKLPPLPQGNASEQRLAQRMDKLVAELRKRTQNQDIAPELTKQLVDLYTEAAKAQTATERMELHQALDAWQGRLTVRFPP